MAVICVSSAFDFGMLLLYCLLWDLAHSGIFTVLDTSLYYRRPEVIYTAISSKNDFLVNKTNFLSWGLLAVRRIHIARSYFLKVVECQSLNYNL